MNYQVRLRVPSCLAVIVALNWCVGSAHGTQPNIIVITSDDAGYNSFGFSSALNNTPTQFETPNLDALAAESVVLKQGYVASPICTPSRIGLLTGQYNNRYGAEEVLSNYNLGDPTWGLVAEQKTIAERLKPLGYSTGAIGKWHVGSHPGLSLPLDRGFDEFYGLHGGGRNYFYETTFSYDRGMYRNNQYYEEQYRMEGDPSKYDPLYGRYVTDAWGEEAVNFIDNHSNDGNPFFLYLAFTASHTPVLDIQVKQADLAHFAHISNPTQRILAAQIYSMDRSIGEVLGALESNGVDDNTIVVFMNDNGPPVFDGTGAPLRGHKGTTWEGGIRVASLIKAPGLDPGVYDHPVTALDMLPTFVAAAGGDVSEIPTDGIDVMPLLSGAETEDPDRVWFWRNMDAWAVRKGDWKLTSRFTRPDESKPPNPPYLFNLANDPHEDVGVGPQNRDIEALLFSEFAHWEATMQKPKWGSLSANNQNQFDHFVFRNDLATTTNWSTANAWRQAGTSSNKTMNRADAYANGVFEFAVRNDADYTATNDMQRLSRQTFMLNQLRLTGNFTGAANRQGTINGNAVLFVKSLTDQLPQIVLDATASGTPAGFNFVLQNELQLLDDLEITGNGTQSFVIGGNIRDFYVPTAPASVVDLITVPHNVRKIGSSWVTLTGNNTFGGVLTVDGGRVIVSGSSAAINGAAGIEIGAAGDVTLDSGTIAVDWLDNSSGGLFNFNGGLLKVVDVAGSLINSGGTYSPGSSPALSTVSGVLAQTAGVMQIEIGGPLPGSQFDKVVVGAHVVLGGTLDVDLINGFTPSAGQMFQFLTAGSAIVGAFANSSLPALPGGLTWQLLYNPKIVALIVAPIGGIGDYLPGDFNHNGTVDVADYTVWRNALQSGNLFADGNFDGLVTQADYSIWKSGFGLSYSGSGSGGMLWAVPEPATLALLVLGGIIGAFRRRRCYPSLVFS